MSVHVAAIVLSGSRPPSVKRPIDAADPLAPIAGRSVVGWVLDAALAASVRRIAVVGAPLPGAAEEIDRRADRALIDQVVPSTSDSIELIGRAIDRLVSDFDERESTHLLLLAAEAPQVEAAELRALIGDHIASGAAATSLGSVEAEDSALSADPLVTLGQDGAVGSIIEPLIAGGSSVFGAICIQAALLVPALRRVTPHGWRHAPLVHDALHELETTGHLVQTVPRAEPLRPIESASTRSPVEAELRRRVVDSWIERGVAIEDPRQVTIDATVDIGQAVRIRPGSVLEGATVVGDGAVIGPNAHLVDATIGTSAVVASAMVERDEVVAREVVEPFTVRGRRSG